MRLVLVSHNTADAGQASLFRARWLQERPHDRLFLSCEEEAGPLGGTEWRSWIRRVVKSCDLVVLIASDGSLSPWCSAELGMATLLGKPVLPLLTTPQARINPVVADIQAALLDQPIAKVLELVDERLGSPAEAAGPGTGFVPYPGLTPLAAEHEAVLGRTALCSRLRDEIEQVRLDGGGRYVVVSGPSGSGKSSLVRAGLLPALRRRGWQVPDVVQPRQLAESGVPGPQPGGSSGLVVIDQAEELLSLPDEQRASITGWTDACIGDGLSVLLVVRSEYRSHLGPLVSEPLDHYVPFVERPDLFDIIRRPARYAQLDVSDTLVDRLVVETGDGDALPLLAYTLNQLWLDRDTATSSLREWSLDRLGGVRGVLTTQAGHALREVTRGHGGEQSKALREQVLRTLSRLASTGQIPPTRDPLPVDSFSVEQRAWLDAFRSRGLLAYRTSYAVDDVIDVDELPGGTDLVDVTHEALFEWQPLAEVIAQERRRNADRRSIEDAALLWDQGGRSDRAMLLAGPRLALAVEDGLDERRGPVGDFVTASVRGDRDRRIRTALVAAVGVLAVVAVAFAAFALVQRGRAEQSRLEAQAVRVAAQANEAVDGRRDLALLAAAEAVRLQVNVDTESALVNALSTPAGPLRYFTDDTARWETLRIVAPDTGVVVTDERGLATVDLRTRTLTDVPLEVSARRLFAVPGSEGVVAFSGVSGEGEALLNHAGVVSLTDGRPRVVDHPTEVTAALAHPGGLLFGDADGGLFFAPTEGAGLGAPTELGGHQDRVTSVTASADGTWVASASPGAVRVHRYDGVRFGDPQPLVDVASGTRTAETLVFRQDGPVELLGAGSDPLVRRWVLADGVFRAGEPLGTHPGVVEAMAVDPEAAVLYTAGMGGAVQRWDLDAGAVVGAPLEAHGDDVLALSTVGGPQLVSADAESAVLWDLAGSRVVPGDGVVPDGWADESFSALVAGDGPLAAVTVDGRVLVDGQAARDGPPGARKAWWTGSETVVVETGNTSQIELPPLALWSVGAEAGAGAVPLVDGVDAAAVGACLATTARGTEVEFLDVGGCGTTPPPFRVGSAPVQAVALSADGSRLAVVDGGSTLQEWDVAGGTSGRSRELLSGTAVTSLEWLGDDDLVVGHDRGADPQVVSLDGDGEGGALVRGHDDAVWWLLVQPQRGRLFSAGQDGRVVQTDLDELRPVGRALVGARRTQENDPLAAVRGLRLSRDGDALVAIHGDSVVAWDVDLESLVDRACSDAGRTLDAAEAGELGVAGAGPTACG